MIVTAIMPFCLSALSFCTCVPCARFVSSHASCVYRQLKHLARPAVTNTIIIIIKHHHHPATADSLCNQAAQRTGAPRAGWPRPFVLRAVAGDSRSFRTRSNNGADWRNHYPASLSASIADSLLGLLVGWAGLSLVGPFLSTSLTDFSEP